ncbi:hypothetical protein BRE01_62410 [Brevibacillus reuszeri]|uniref:Uncharacterized protein n=2 Tax=Brevibacillus reuszeri TaxID=54915 RepID=A0ABQ0TXQ4_9BACL|nr:hypothetical protein [Brevibacillus reuszeri]GED72539.1 hypothetical protein BRE01_62410 [Brevibacillus reuszeri]
MKKYTHIQFKQDEHKPYQVNIIAEVEENGWFYTDIIGRFSFYDMSGNIILENGTRKHYKRFSAMMNLVYTLDQCAMMDSNLIETVKGEAKQLKQERLMEVVSEQQEESTTNTIETKINTTDEVNENTTYTAFNRSFSSYDEAYNFCTSCDFDPSIIQQEGLTTVIPVDLQYFSSSTEQAMEEDNIKIDQQEIPSILYFNTYNPEQLTHTQWQQDISKHTAKYNELSNNEILSHDEFQSLIDNNYRFWVKVVNKNPYYHKDSYLIELFLSYINKQITFYIERNTYKQISINN